MTRPAQVAARVAIAALAAGCGDILPRDESDTGTDEPAGDGPAEVDGLDVPEAPDVEQEEVEPECFDDSDCTEDEACPSPGGCDGNPCRDDRCREGTCTYIDLEGCVEGYLLEYRYSACCPWRTLLIEPGGVCTFTIEGTGSSPCDIPPSFLTSIVDQADLLGFFGWGAEHCVPSSMLTDFSLRMTDGTQDNTISCEDSSCVGDLCDLVTEIQVHMPSNWHEGCGCT